MRIVLDAMGTDGAPASEVAGALGALRELENDFELILVGDRSLVEAELARHEDFPRHRLHLEHAPDRVLPGEAAASVLRKHPDCSIVRGLRLQKEGQADAFVSAGSTGAVMAASLFILKPLEGVARPAIGTLLPTSRDPVLMLDAGANVDCKPQHLVQFAHLGHIYAQDLMGRTHPRIGLLNIGEEPEKGDELALETHQRLAREPGLHFVGNIEGREIIKGSCDVLVCDGFVGNVLLKFYESVAQFIVGFPAAGADPGRIGARVRGGVPRPGLLRIRRRPTPGRERRLDHLPRGLLAASHPERGPGGRPVGALLHGRARRP